MPAAFPANEKAQVAWIGIGGRWGNLADLFLKNVPDARTAAVCDLIPERVENGKKVFERDKPNGYTDLRKMIEKEKLDGILVVTGSERPRGSGRAGAGSPHPLLCGKTHGHDGGEGGRDHQGRPQGQGGHLPDRHPAPLQPAAPGGDGTDPQRQDRQDHVHAGALALVLEPVPIRNEKYGGFLVEQACHHADVMAWAMGDKAPATCVAIARTQQPMPEGPNVWSEQQSATSGSGRGRRSSPTRTSRGWPEVPGRAACRFTARRAAWTWLTASCTDATKTGSRAKTIDEPKDQFADDPRGDWGMGTKEELQAFVANIKADGKQPINANVESGRIATLMCIMGRMAAVNPEKNVYEPRVIRWKDLGTTTDLVV